MRKYGWIPDLPDIRDDVLLPRVTKLPAKVDLSKDQVIFDQGQLGSCVGHGVAEAFKFAAFKQDHRAEFNPSRLFIYYNARVMEGTGDEDSGAMIRDAIKSVNKQGACNEDRWPYDVDKYADRPSKDCFSNAMGHQTLKYSRVNQTSTALKQCLADGYPFVFGFSVYEYFESEQMAETGILKMPGKYEEFLGGHCTLSVGYDESKKMFLIQNSWGKDWGLKGFFWMPYAYMTNNNLVDDIWTIRKTEI